MSHAPLALGIRFGSSIEEERYRELELLERAGLIRDLEPHPRFVLFGKTDRLPAIHYTADSGYVDCRSGARVVEDVKVLRWRRGKAYKPTETQAVRLRMSVFRHVYPNVELRIEYREMKGRR